MKTSRRMGRSPVLSKIAYVESGIYADKLHGMQTVNKLSFSTLLGKMFKSSIYPFILFEPGIYLAKDNTELFDYGGILEYKGNSKLRALIGSGFGFGCNYYFKKYIGISASTQFDFAYNRFWIIYPSTQVGFILTY